MSSITVPAPGAGRLRRLGAADLFELRYLRDARMSPDGRHSAYALSRTENGEELFEIHIVDLSDGRSRRLPYSGKALWPRWSPDGKWLAFVGDARLRIAATSTWVVAESLTPEGLAVQGAPSWSPDSENLAVSLLRREAVIGPQRITTRHFRAEGIGFIDNFTQCIHTVGRSLRDLRCLTGPTEGICSQPEWSPCGRRMFPRSWRS